MEYSDVTEKILGCCFEVMKELGSGFLERVYKNALFIALRQRGMQVETEKNFEVVFREKVVGRYSADLIVDRSVIVELKCVEHLLREHQAQLINYLQVSKLPVGLLVNFQRRKLEYKRVYRPEEFIEFLEEEEEKVPF